MTVRAIVWTGALPADQFDELLIQVKLPAEGGRLAFPALQSCGATAVRWADPVPPAGPRPKHPAPTLTVNRAPAPEGRHDHHD